MIDQGARQVRRGGGDDDAVIGCVFGPSERAVAVADLDIVIAKYDACPSPEIPVALAAQTNKIDQFTVFDDRNNQRVFAVRDS